MVGQAQDSKSTFFHHQLSLCSSDLLCHGVTWAEPEFEEGNFWKIGGK